MAKSEYRGTKNLNIRVAINRLYELLDKSLLGGNDEEFYKEAKEVIEKELMSQTKGSDNWNKVKDKLTAKQLLHVLEGEE